MRKLSIQIFCSENNDDVTHHFIANVFNARDKHTSKGGKPGKDYQLSRYARYLIAQNGNPRIPEIAHAQKYFTFQTRKMELAKEYQLETKRNRHN
ncbi:MAG: hypothetical protein JXR30_01300 [Alphaproteobacteria bacterium]|nr:hypothetical protein [Alphaproteobacteria bacterium]